MQALNLLIFVDSVVLMGAPLPPSLWAALRSAELTQWVEVCRLIFTMEDPDVVFFKAVEELTDTLLLGILGQLINTVRFAAAQSS